MKYVGAHVSIAGGVENAPLRAQEIGADSFALFTKNQRQWQAKPFSDANIRGFQENVQKTGIAPGNILVHDGYLINLGNPDKEKREKSLNLFAFEAQRVEQLGLSLLNLHPGSHLGLVSEQECLALIAEAIRATIQKTKGVVFVLETTAGQGSNIGYRFEHLADIIEQVGDDSRMGVCLDTCHLYAAGYDIKDDFDGVMKEFEQVVGLQFLKGVHLNDSKSCLGQRLDRHHSLGEGELGWHFFKNLMRDSRFEDMPLVLETIDSDRWPSEIKQLRNFA